MICPLVLFPVTLSDPYRRFQGHGDALDELCAQLTRDLFAIAKFLLNIMLTSLRPWLCTFSKYIYQYVKIWE